MSNVSSVYISPVQNDKPCRMFVQWRSQALTELINKIKTLVNVQFFEADKALIGRGNFVLTKDHVRHATTIDRWDVMSERQRDHL